VSLTYKVADTCILLLIYYVEVRQILRWDEFRTTTYAKYVTVSRESGGATNFARHRCAQVKCGHADLRT